MAKYRMVTAQWALIEGSMSEHYGLSLRDILTMSWRRFRILYGHLFTAGHLTKIDSDTNTGPVNQRDPKRKVQFDPIDDWNKLVGKPPPDTKRMISFDQFAKGSGIQRKIIDG